jgi:hypothetical protein
MTATKLTILLLISSNLCGFLFLLFSIGFYLGKNPRGGNLISPQEKAGLMNRIELMTKHSPDFIYIKSGFYIYNPQKSGFIYLENPVNI